MADISRHEGDELWRWEVLCSGRRRKVHLDERQMQWVEMCPMPEHDVGNPRFNLQGFLQRTLTKFLASIRFPPNSCHNSRRVNVSRRAH